MRPLRAHSDAVAGDPPTQIPGRKEAIERKSPQASDLSQAITSSPHSPLASRSLCQCRVGNAAISKHSVSLTIRRWL
eukprot:3511863-Pyramimonas_sp.AAC.1